MRLRSHCMQLAYNGLELGVSIQWHQVLCVCEQHKDLACGGVGYFNRCAVCTILRVCLCSVCVVSLQCYASWMYVLSRELLFCIHSVVIWWCECYSCKYCRACAGVSCCPVDYIAETYASAVMSIVKCWELCTVWRDKPCNHFKYLCSDQPLALAASRTAVLPLPRPVVECTPIPTCWRMNKSASKCCTWVITVDM
jgi:hypothetical protein